MAIALDLSGKKFHRLTAVSPIPSVNGRGSRQWHCVCECGRQTLVVTNKLVTGATKSCGCYNRDKLISNGRGKTHGYSKKNDATYNTWCAMRERVREGYHGASRYFDRGIVVCERWSEYENFLEDMGPRPDGTTIDRIDNNGNYEPGNCRWTTSKVQQRNRSNTLYLTIRGEKRAAADVAEDLGVGNHVMQAAFRAIRLLRARYGDEWSIYGP